MSIPLLSQSWRVKSSHASFYTGGKVVLSSCNSFLLTMHGDDVVKLEIETGRVVWTLESKGDSFLSFALAPNDCDLVVACKSGLIKRFKVGEAEVLGSFKGHELPVTEMSIDPSSKLVVTASIDKTLRVWHIEGGFCTHSLRNGHNSPVRKCWFAPKIGVDTILIASSDDEGGLVIWELATADKAVVASNSSKKKKTGQSVISHSLVNHMSAVNDVSFHMEADVLVSVSRDKVLNIWDLSNYSLIRTIPIFESAESICFVPPVFPKCPKVSSSISSPTENLFCAIAGENGYIRILHLKNGKTVYQQPAPLKVEPITRLLVGDGFCISISSEHNFMLWDLSSFERKKLIVGFNDEIVNIKCFPSNVGTAIDNNTSNWAVVATNSDQIRLLNLHNFDTDLLTGHTDLVLAVDISPDGKHIVSVSSDCTVRIWRVDIESTVNWECIAVGTGHTDAIAAVAANKKLDVTMFFVSGSKDRTLKLWSYDDIDNKVIVPKHTVVAHDKDINCVAVAPHDKLIASASADKTIKLWDPELALVGILRGHKRGVWSVEFSKVDKVIASASGDRTIRIWSVTDFACLKTLEGHVSAVLGVQFISHGTQLLSTATDGCMKLWTLKTSECVATYDEHADKTWGLSLTSDGKHVVTGGADSVIHIWQDVTVELLDEKENANATRVLQEQELNNSLVLKDYKRAIKLAIKLQQPRKLMNTLETVLTEENSSSNASENSIFDEVLQTLSKEEQIQLIKFCRDWNTNAKHSAMAQHVLNVFFRILPPSSIKQLQEIKEIVSGLIPYTERHFTRINNLMQKSYVIDFILASMKTLNPIDLEINSKNLKRKEI